MKGTKLEKARLAEQLGNLTAYLEQHTEGVWDSMSGSTEGKLLFDKNSDKQQRRSYERTKPFDLLDV